MTMKKQLFIILIVAVAAGASAYYFFALKPSADKKVSASGTTNTAAKKSFNIPKPPGNNQATQQVIDEIRKELQNVMVLNEKINQTQSSKAAQLLRIQEQAATHQRILANIEQISDLESPAVPTRDALLAQEKLRIIREETLRNKKILEKASPKTTS